MKCAHPSMLLLVVCLFSFGAGSERSSILPKLDRQAHDLTGSEFLKLHASLPAHERERAIYEQISAGNTPDFLGQLKAVEYKGFDLNGREHTVTLFVTPDYMSIGNNVDYVRMPMTPMTAQRIADELDLLIPTPLIVDKIYEQSTLKLRPLPLTPSPEMTTSRYFRLHNSKIQSQMAGFQADEHLVAGHKKDIVLTRQLAQAPEQVAIYGWHRDLGKPIQPLSLVHQNAYVDYSHGVRFVHKSALIDGRPFNLEKVLRDSVLSPLVSGEGVIDQTAYRYEKGPKLSMSADESEQSRLHH